MPKLIVTEEMLADFLQHPVTEAIRAALNQRRRALHQRWEQGEFTYPTGEATSLANARAIGQLEEICWFLELDVDILKGELDGTDEPEWLDPPGKGSVGKDGGDRGAAGDEHSDS